MTKVNISSDSCQVFDLDIFFSQGHYASCLYRSVLFRGDVPVLPLHRVYNRHLFDLSVFVFFCFFFGNNVLIAKEMQHCNKMTNKTNKCHTIRTESPSKKSQIVAVEKITETEAKLDTQNTYLNDRSFSWHINKTFLVKDRPLLSLIVLRLLSDEKHCVFIACPLYDLLLLSVM